MKQYAEVFVSLERFGVYVFDAEGQIVREAELGRAHIEARIGSFAVGLPPRDSLAPAGESHLRLSPDWEIGSPRQDGFT